jgi:hypothetical protein
MHEVFGYPPTSKRRWKLVVSAYDWTCTCKEGKKHTKDLSIANEQDYKDGIDVCRYCGKNLIKAKERVTWIECSWCKQKV